MIYKNKVVILIQNNTVKNKVIKPIITQTTSIYFIKIVHKIKSLNNRLKEKMELKATVL